MLILPMADEFYEISGFTTKCVCVERALNFYNDAVNHQLSTHFIVFIVFCNQEFRLEKKRNDKFVNLL